MNKLHTEICEILNIEKPIFQGAMAWIADHYLASSVSNAGGLGIIAAGHAPVEWVRNEINKTKELTDKPFALNIMLLSPYSDEIAKLVCELNVPILTTGAGSPGKYIDIWIRNGIKVIPVVASVAMAKRMERLGAHAVIAEGCEAGGHIGELTTMALVPQVVDAVNIPVIAAGGIGDGRGMAAAFMLGASGVQIGTRFLVSADCTVHENYKKRVLKAKDIDSVVTGRPTGHPVRVLRNKLTNKFKELEKKKSKISEFENLGKGTLPLAVKEGDISNGSVMAGQIAGLINKQQSSKEIIDEIIKETLERFEKF